MFGYLEDELRHKELLYNKQSIIDQLSKAFLNSIKTKEKVGIAFSGGVDSSLLAVLCSKLSIKFKLYTVGLENSKDVIEAIKISKIMKWPIKIKILTLTEAESIIKNVVDILDSDDVTRVGVGCVTYCVCKMAKDDNIKTVLTGLGSEELFAGYERHKKNVYEECWNGLKSIEERDVTRDEELAKYFKIKLLLPFLNEDIVKIAMIIDPELKIKDGVNKYILRETAVSLGLPKEYAFRKKIAAQYGSKFDRAILRLARKNKFKYKKDYLKSLI
ncbi:MAG: asparagine synthase C-terminal domain-containing protein [Candidatus Woesearchaeota archaeon]|nr:asparagine synthase C-terminal domain-containing protein [Candidatus Woesearchaeota archaeon]